MAEFVQQHLEELVGVFKELKKSQIMKEDEVRDMIQKIRHYDYSINKRTKRPKDFIRYGEYIKELLVLIRKRGAKLKVQTRFDKIVEPLRKHGAHMYRICSTRFKKVEYFRHEIQFLKDTKQFGLLTKVYTNLLQLHGKDPRNHEEAGRWEFFSNRSAENARAILQLALRNFPTDADLWFALFEVELNNVIVLLERRAMLSAKDGIVHDDNDVFISLEGVSDAVLEFKLVEIVVQHAISSLSTDNDRIKFVKCCLECAEKAGSLAEKVVVFLKQKQDTLPPEAECKVKCEEPDEMKDPGLKAKSAFNWQGLHDISTDFEVLKKTFENELRSHGSPEGWIEYARCCMNHKPSEVQQVFKRALINLNTEFHDEFSVRWINFMQESSEF